MREQQSRTLAVGRVVKPHGIRGELVVEVLTDSPELRFASGAALDVQRRGEDRTQKLTVVAARRAEGVDDRTAAEQLRGALLVVDASEVEPTDDPDEFHDVELEGLRVLNTGGDELGRVHEVVHTPAGELLAVRTGDGREVLVPFVSEIVPEVDLEAGKLVVDPPEGLFDA